VLTVCSQRIYLLKLLRSQGLLVQQFHTVFVALILSRITHAISAWRGQLTRQLQERVDAFLKRATKFCFCEENYTTAELPDKADARRFRLLQRPEHCLYHLLSDTINSCSMELRLRGHSFPFLSANITCIKTHLYHDVCSNMYSYWWIDGLYVI